MSSPFVDEAGVALLDRLRRVSYNGGPRIRVVIPPALRDLFRARWNKEVADFQVIEQPGLHAKVYALVGNSAGDCKALVTSANLTSAGMARNLEVGLRITGSEGAYVSLIERLASRVATEERERGRPWRNTERK